MNLRDVILFMIFILILLVISPVDLMPGTDIDDMGYGIVILGWFLKEKLSKSKG